MPTDQMTQDVSSTRTDNASPSVSKIEQTDNTALEYLEANRQQPGE